jgi:hypothetical protein
LIFNRAKQVNHDDFSTPGNRNDVSHQTNELLKNEQLKKRKEGKNGQPTNES